MCVVFFGIDEKPCQRCENWDFHQLGQNTDFVQVATQKHFFRSSLDAQHTHQKTSRHRFSSACQLRGEQITQVRIVMSAEHGRFCGCVKPTCFSRFREGSHTRANFQMRSMGIFGVFLLFLTEIRINALFWDSDAPVAFSALPVNRSDAFKKERYRLKSAPIGHRFDENRTIR